MDPKVILIIGLSISSLGTALLFFWPPPGEPVMKDQEIITIGDDILKTDESPSTSPRWYRHRLLSRCGLGAIFLGFLLQLLGTIQA